MRARAWLRNQFARERWQGAGRCTRRRLSALFPDLHDEPLALTRAVDPDGSQVPRSRIVTPAVSHSRVMPTTPGRFYGHIETVAISSTGPAQLLPPQKGTRARLKRRRVVAPEGDHYILPGDADAQQEILPRSRASQQRRWKWAGR